MIAVRTLVGIVLAGAAFVSTVVPQRALSAKPQPTATPSLAPADEYFGRLHMSFLGINNTLHDANITAGDHTTDPVVINKVDFAVEALEDWRSKYPGDRQLPRSTFLAVQLFKKIWTKPYQDKAWEYMLLIVEQYPNTFFGKQVTKDLKGGGFTEHYYYEAVPCYSLDTPPPPTPGAPLRTKAGLAFPKVELLEAPCYTPSPIPTPSPTATALASQTPIPLTPPPSK